MRNVGNQIRPVSGLRQSAILLWGLSLRCYFVDDFRSDIAFLNLEYRINYDKTIRCVGQDK